MCRSASRGSWAASRARSPPTTSAVLIEAADFSAMAVGRTARRQQLRTEASTRFWRGIDPEGQVRAADRVAGLIVAAARAAGAAPPVVAAGVIDLWPTPVARRTIHLRPERLNVLLGTSLGSDAICGYLTPIGFATRSRGRRLAVTVPSFRPDVEREVDVIEEVARHLGYDHIAPTRKRSPGVGLLTAHQADRRRLAGLVAGYGADEAWTSSIVNPGYERRLGTGAAPVGLVNPIVREESALRTSLLPGLLGCLRHNASVRNPAVRLFEIGHVFAHPGAGRDAAGRARAARRRARL